MRLIAIIPIILSATALILTFLCMFAGSRPGFMEDYAVITLNTSRFGENVVNLTASNSNSGDNSNPFQSLINDLTNTISQDINDGLNFVSRDLGLRDWYSLHVLNYCEGYYEPGPVANASFSSDSIYKNITSCGNRTALFDWNPRQQLQDDLDSHGFGWLNVSYLKWPDAVDSNIDDFHTTLKTTFALYCVAAAFMFFAFVLAIVGIFLVGRGFISLNLVVDLIAFLAVLIASAIVTAIMQAGSKNINNYGAQVGIQAYGSSKLLAITWVATALMFVASVIWCIACCTGRGDKTSTRRRGWGSRRRGPDADIGMSTMKSQY